MKVPLSVHRWLHHRNFSRKKMHGSFLHSRLGDRLLDKELWRTSPRSLARAWLIGFPITSIPWLPFQSIIAGVLGFTFRANLLLCIGLQYLSNPVTAIVHLPPCYFVGKLMLGSSPGQTWDEMMKRDWVQVFHHPTKLAHDLLPLYLGAITLGTAIAIIGYFAIYAWGLRWQRRQLHKRAVAAAAKKAAGLASTTPPIPTEAGDI